MDVVRKNIENLRGKVEIESEIGAGSTFRILVPLTMAIIYGLVVKVGDSRFILPSNSVKVALCPDEASLTQRPRKRGSPHYQRQSLSTQTTT